MIVIKNVGDFKKEYPSPKTKNFLSLKEYEKIAEKVIKTYAPKNFVDKLIKSEDCISEIMHQLMVADWNYDEEKGRTPNSWRYYCGIKTIKKLYHYNKNTNVSLDEIMFDEEKPINLHDMIEDKEIKKGNFFNSERKSRVKKQIQYLMKHTKLSPLEKKCLHLRYVEEAGSYREIGERIMPPITKQAVEQAIRSAKFKLKQNALGT